MAETRILLLNVVWTHEQFTEEPTDKSKSSWMVDHWRTKHRDPDKDPMDPWVDFKFNILGKHRDPMTRQVEEAVRITQGLEKQTITQPNNEIKPIRCLNRKGEMFGPRERTEFT